MLKKSILILLSLILMTACSNTPEIAETETVAEGPFRIISGSENKDIEDRLMAYAKEQKIDLRIDYAGTLEIMDILNADSTAYDAVWPSNSIWLNMLNEPSKIKNSKFTSINPIVFGIRLSKARELSFVDSGQKIFMKDIVQAVKENKLNFIMPSATQTNSGASAYLGFLTCLADKDGLGMLTTDELQSAELKEELGELFQGVARSSGDEGFAGELFINGSYDAIVNYEASIINLNRQLESKGMEPLYMVYPYDGVSLSDSPFAYIDNQIPGKEDQFFVLQDYLLSKDSEEFLKASGRRTGYGGLIADEDKDIFRSDWGIKTNQYISPIHYPSVSVIKEALNLYQNELRKPLLVAFCLDYSGSMIGEGKDSLAAAMDYILDYNKASEDFIQFSERDNIYVIPFSNEILDMYNTTNGRDTLKLIDEITAKEAQGGTDIYLPVAAAINLFKEMDTSDYACSIILMTDGESNENRFRELKAVYEDVGLDIPVFSITFGEADESQLLEIAKLTNGKVFNGNDNLVGAFKSIRGYN